jgi:hypothetical protein
MPGGRGLQPRQYQTRGDEYFFFVSFVSFVPFALGQSLDR